MKKTSLKYSFMDLVKFKINELIVAHGWILKTSQVDGETYYRVVVTELSAIGNSQFCVHNGSAFGKALVDAFIEKHLGNKIYVKEQDLRKDFVKID